LEVVILAEVTHKQTEVLKRIEVCRGFVFLLNGGAISWGSMKQTSIVLSTTEAEYIGLTQAAKQILWLQVLLDEIGAFTHIQPISTLNGNNQGAIALSLITQHMMPVGSPLIFNITSFEI